MSTAKMAIKLYPGVSRQAEQLHLEGLKPSISMATRDTLAPDKKVKKALHIKAYKSYINLILNCMFLRPPWSLQAKFKFWPKVWPKIRKGPISITHIMALCCRFL